MYRRRYLVESDSSLLLGHLTKYMILRTVLASDNLRYYCANCDDPKLLGSVILSYIVNSGREWVFRRQSVVDADNYRIYRFDHCGGPSAIVARVRQ